MKRRSIVQSKDMALGMKKQGRSGTIPKSPRLRLEIKMEAEKKERKIKSGNMYDDIRETFKSLRRNK